MTHTGNMVLPEPVPAFTRESRLAMTSRRLSSCIWHRTLAPAVTVHNNKIALNTRAILLPFGGRDMRKLRNGSRLSCMIVLRAVRSPVEASLKGDLGRLE